MLLEVNAVYEHDDHIVVQAGDVAAARLLLKEIATEQIIRREEMHAEDNQADTLTVLKSADEQGKSFNVNGQYPARKLVGRKVATPVFPARMVASGKVYRSRRGWIAASVAAALIALLLLPGSSWLAGQIFSLFQIQQFKAVQVSPPEVATLFNFSG